MTRRAIVTAGAEADLLDIATYIASDNPAAPDRFVDPLRSNGLLLADHPQIGRRYGRHGSRLFPVGNCVIVFREMPGGIEVIR